jgi:hypothetical protein
MEAGFYVAANMTTAKLKKTIKLKFALEQARKAKRGSRDVALFFL